jgi:prepilin-type N-terminal cleavage/methylation domain-containing protein
MTPIAIACSSCAELRGDQRGFSLVEMAIAVFIMALLIGSFLVPLQSQVEIRKIDETQRILDQAREALMGFVAGNGRFPCPATAGSTGVESFAGGGNAANGNCSNFFDGFLPAITIGFTPVDGSGYALDAWGLQQNRIRYAVSNVTVSGVTNPFTKTGGIRSAGMANISAANMLYVCNSGTGVTASNCGTATALTSNAIAVIYSLGANAPNGGSAPHESKNLDADRVFVLTERSSVTGSIFDDQVTWIGSPTLFNRMISAGILP